MSVTLRCPKCGHEIDRENPLCVGCGAKLKVKPLKLPETPVVRILKKALDENEARLDARLEKVRGAGELVGEEGAAVAAETHLAVATPPPSSAAKVRPGILPYQFVSGTWDKWLFRGLAVLLFLAPYFIQDGSGEWYWNILMHKLSNFGYLISQLLPIAFLALSFGKRPAIWVAWGGEVLLCMLWILKVVNGLRFWNWYGAYGFWRWFWFLLHVIEICLVVVLAISHACPKKALHATAWLGLLGIYATRAIADLGPISVYVAKVVDDMAWLGLPHAYYMPAIGHLGPISAYDALNSMEGGIFCVLTFLVFSRMRKQSAWIGRLDVLDRKWSSVYAPGGDRKFLKFFSVFCWWTLAISLVGALVFFFTEVEIGGGLWGSHMVRLFELVPLFSGNAWIYWSWVAGWSFCIVLAAVHSASVERTANCHLAHLELEGGGLVERNGALYVCGIASKVAGVLLAVTSVAGVLLVVASLVESGMEISPVLGTVCLLCGGVTAVWQWGWGSMFCAQAWNEGAAQWIQSGVQSEGGRCGLRFLKFFSVFCWWTLAISLVGAFFATVEIGGGLCKRWFELVPLFSGSAWIYWSWVAGWSFCIMVTAIYSASVERTANCHLAHLESRGAVRVERNGALHVCGIACKVVGVLLAVASVAWVLLAVASLVDPGMEISQGETVLGIVCLLCGAVWQWGWGSMFCAQAWNEGAAQRILSGAQSEGGRRGLATKKVLSTLDAYRALAIELGADAVGVGDLERGDAEVRKLLENKDVSQDAAQRTGREAAASYRKACEKGALAKAASLAEESRRAYGQRQWKEAFLRAEEALYFAPSDPGMVRLMMQAWWKKNRFFVMLAGGLLLVALVVRLVVS